MAALCKSSAAVVASIHRSTLAFFLLPGWCIQRLLDRPLVAFHGSLVTSGDSTAPSRADGLACCLLLASYGCFLPPPVFIHIQVHQQSLFLDELPSMPDPSNQYGVGVQSPGDALQLVLLVVFLLFRFAALVVVVVIQGGFDRGRGTFRGSGGAWCALSNRILGRQGGDG
jgi:hypothetical protein